MKACDGMSTKGNHKIGDGVVEVKEAAAVEEGQLQGREKATGDRGRRSNFKLREIDEGYHSLSRNPDPLFPCDYATSSHIRRINRKINAC